jgi:hypothetical protein
VLTDRERIAAALIRHAKAQRSARERDAGRKGERQKVHEAALTR